MSKSRFSISERWTESLGSESWTPVSNAFLDLYGKLGITHSEAMFVIHLMQFKWSEDAPFPKLGTIAKRMGISTTAVRTHARKLEKKGFLKRERRPGKSNYFLLGGLFAALKREIIEIELVKQSGNEASTEFEISSEADISRI